ncbi:MAG: hypothetical protein ACRD8Z_28945 [Nitrososphaeraceae archaeon]
MKMMRVLDLVGRILTHGNHVEVKKSNQGLMLIVRPQKVLSRDMGGLIMEGGFKLQRCYSDPGGRAVLVFLNDRVKGEEYVEYG